MLGKTVPFKTLSIHNGAIPSVSVKVIYPHACYRSPQLPWYLYLYFFLSYICDRNLMTSHIFLFFNRWNLKLYLHLHTSMISLSMYMRASLKWWTRDSTKAQNILISQTFTGIQVWHYTCSVYSNVLFVTFLHIIFYKCPSICSALRSETQYMCSGLLISVGCAFHYCKGAHV
jgi:hypothetical protein